MLKYKKIKKMREVNIIIIGEVNSKYENVENLAYRIYS